MLQVPTDKGDGDTVSVISAYKEGETFNQVSDLLKGIIKQDQLHIEKHLQKEEQVVAEPVIQYEEPLHLKVNVPKIDYNALHIRQVEFERRKNDWLAKLAK